MSNYTKLCPYCFSNRRTKDQDHFSSKYVPESNRCHKCGQEMVTLPYWARIPKKNNKKGWKNFFKYFKDWGFLKDIPETNKVKKYK